MGIIYASYLGSISTDVNGGQQRAVRGGRRGHRRHQPVRRPGKMLGAVLGGLIVAVIYNGLELLGLGAAAQNIWTAAVLIAAVTVDTTARRGQSTSK